MDKLTQVKNFLDYHVFRYDEILSDKCLDIIHDLLINNIKPTNELLQELDDDVIYLFYGIYYERIEENIEKSIGYYLLSANKGNHHAMNNLGRCYEDLEEYDLVMKYYLMAIDKGSVRAMNNLGLYYHQEIKNYELTEKYLLMAIEKDEPLAMYNLGTYYQKIGNYGLMEKYLLMAIEKGDTDAMVELAEHYQAKIDKNGDYLKYYLMAIDNGRYEIVSRLQEVIDKEEFERYLILGADHGSEKCIRKINRILDKFFDIELATKAHAYLNDQNLAILNKTICHVLRIAEKNSSAEILYRFCCVDCKEGDINCVFLKCGHPVCYRCYDDAKCRLCNQK